MDVTNLKGKCEAANQAHLLQFWDQLNAEEQNALASEISGIDFQDISAHLRAATQSHQNMNKEKEEDLELPNPDICGGTIKDSSPVQEDYKKIGLTAIGNNEVAALVLAGGQGSRLGVASPKGMFNVDLPSGKSLFQLQAERIRRLTQLAEEYTGKKCQIPWYIMTSVHTNKETVQYLEANNFFELGRDNVATFEQTSFPCFDLNGQILLESKAKIAFAPDGNGALYRAMREHKILADLEERGIKFVHVLGVDNILIRIADPMFVGFTKSKNMDLVGKIVEKKEPFEGLSVVCRVKGIHGVLHYHEMPREIAEKRDLDGKLKYRAGIVGDLMYSTRFLRYLCQPEQDSKFEYHLALKTVPYMDRNGQFQQPTSPNAIKLEKFLFDDLNFPFNLGLWEVIREDEFSPLKNRDGEASHTPSTCRNDLLDLHQRFVLAAGGTFVQSDNPSHDRSDTCDPAERPIVCEISPLITYAGEGLETLVKGRQLSSPVLLEVKE